MLGLLFGGFNWCLFCTGLCCYITAHPYLYLLLFYYWPVSEENVRESIISLCLSVYQSCAVCVSTELRIYSWGKERSLAPSCKLSYFLRLGRITCKPVRLGTRCISRGGHWPSNLTHCHLCLLLFDSKVCLLCVCLSSRISSQISNRSTKKERHTDKEKKQKRGFSFFIRQTQFSLTGLPWYGTPNGKSNPPQAEQPWIWLFFFLTFFLSPFFRFVVWLDFLMTFHWGKARKNRNPAFLPENPEPGSLFTFIRHFLTST